VRLLLDTGKINIDCKNNYSLTPWDCGGGNYYIKYLFEEYAGKNAL
jgi:hypothetical protein